MSIHLSKGIISGRIMILALLTLSLIFPLFMTQTYYLSTLIFCGINAIAVLGLDILMGYAGQISLGHAAFIGIGAYTSGILSANYGYNPWISMTIGVLVTMGFAYIISIPTLRLRGYFLAIATLGFCVIIRVLLVFFHDLTGGVSGLNDIPSFSFFGISLNNEFRFYYLLWAFVALAMLATNNLAKSGFGRALRAIEYNDIRAGARGVDVSAYKRRAFIFSAALASISGALYGHYIHFITPFNFGLMDSIMLVVMVIVGGMGSRIGSLLGAGIITILPEALRSVAEGETIVYGLIIVLVMIFMPTGLVGGARRVMSMLSTRGSGSPLRNS